MLIVALTFCANTSLFGQDRILVRQVEFYHENDALKFRKITDQYYSFGLFLGFKSVLKEESKLARLTQKIGFLPREKVLLSNELFVKGFTPERNKDGVDEPRRPFAGISGLKTTISISNSTRIWTMGTFIGVRGKISGAEWVQYNFHQLISSPIFEGWENQLPNKFLFGIHGAFIKPFFNRKWFQAVSRSSLSLGNYQILLEEDLGVQIGLFNKPDRSSIFHNFIDRKTGNKPEYYVYASVFGRAIATDATLALDSHNQKWLNPLDKRNLLAGYQIKFIFQTGRVGGQMGYTRVSTESNLSSKHSYGTLGITYSFR